MAHAKYARPSQYISRRAGLLCGNMQQGERTWRLCNFHSAAWSGKEFDLTAGTVRFWVKKLAHPKFYFGVSRDEKCFDLMCISRKVSESLLRYGNPELLSWCHRNIWCRCLWQDVSLFLESLEFFMTYVNLCLTKICLFIVKILSQSCNFWCAQKNVKNGDLEFSNHKNNAYPLLSKVFANI